MRDGKPVLMQAAGDSAHRRQGRASRSAFISSSAAVRSSRSATPTAISRCCEWTAAGSGARFWRLVHHTDAAREWAYDRQSTIGHLDTALDEAQAKGWTVVDMKNDWKTIYPPAK